MSGMFPDERVVVEWVMKFRDEAKDLPGFYRRANRAFDDAVKNQRKNNALMMQSARESANAERRRFQQQRADLAEFQRLSQSETRIMADRDKAARRSAREQERIDSERVRVKRRVAREARDVLREEAEANLALESTLDAIETRRKRRIRDRRAEAATRRAEARRDAAAPFRDRKQEARETLTGPALNRRIGELDDAMRVAQRRAAERADKTVNRDIQTIGREEDRAAARARREAAGAIQDVARRREAAVTRIEIEEHERTEIARVRRDAARDEEKRTKDELARLETLRGQFPGVEDTLHRHRGARRDLGVEKAFRATNADLTRMDRSMMRFRTNLAKFRDEVVRTGGLSEHSWNRMTQHARALGLSIRELNHEGRILAQDDKKIGFNFGKALDPKNLRLLRDIEQERSKFARVMATILRIPPENRDRRTGRFVGDDIARVLLGGRGFGGGPGPGRTQGHDPIGRGIASLFPGGRAGGAAALIIGSLTGALQALLAGVAALAAAIAPLTGEIAGLAPVAASAAFAMATLKLGLSNLGNAGNDLSKLIEASLLGSMKDYRAALAGLTPEQRAFAEQLRGMRKGFLQFKADVSAPLFRGLSAGLTGAQPTLRALRVPTRQVAGAIGGAFSTLGRELGSPEWQKALTTQGERTANWVRELTPALIHLARAFRTLMIAASPLVDHLIDLLNKGFADLDHFLTRVAANGQLNRFFEQTNKTLDTSLSLLWQLTMALVNIGRVGFGSGNSMLKGLNDGAKALNKWTTSAHGVNTLNKAFAATKPTLIEMGKLLVAIFKSVLAIGSQKATTQLFHSLRTDVLPVMTQLAQVATQIVSVFVEGITTVVHALSTLLEKVKPVKFIVEALFGTLLAAQGLRFLAAITGLRNLFGWVTKTYVGMARLNAESAAVNARFNLLSGGLISRRATNQVPVGGLSPLASSRMFPRLVGTGVIESADPGVALRQRLFGGFRDRLMSRGGISGIGLGLGALTAGELLQQTGGRTARRVGGLLTNVGFGASIGATIAPGTPWGVGIGAAAGLLLSLKGMIHSGNELSRAHDRTRAAADEASAALRSIASARQALPGARLDVSQARLDLRNTRRAEAQAQRDFRAGKISRDDLTQATIDVRRAELAYAKAVKDLAAASKTLANGVKVFNQDRAKVVQQLLGGRDFKALGTDLVGRGPLTMQERERRSITRQQLAYFQTLAKDSKDTFPHLAKVAEKIAEIIQLTGKIPTTKEINILIKTTTVRPDDRAVHGVGATGPGKKKPTTTPTPAGSTGTGGRGGAGIISPASIPFGGANLSALNANNLLFDSGFSAGFSAGAGGTPPAVAGIAQSLAGSGIRVNQAAAVMTAVTGQATLAGMQAIAGSLNAAAQKALADFAAHPNNKTKATVLAGLQNAMQAVQAAIGAAIGKLVFQAQQLADQFAQRQSLGQLKLEARNIDPNSVGAIDFGTFWLKRQLVNLRKQQKLLKEALEQTLVAPGATAADKKAARDALNAVNLQIATATTGLVKNRFGRIRAQFAAREARDAFGLSKAQTGLSTLEAQQRIGQTFDTTGGAQARAEFIRKNIVPALDKEISTLQEEWNKRKQEKLTAQERRDLQAKIQQAQLDKLNAIADATELTAQSTAKIAQINGQLSFGFQGQQYTDLVGAVTGS